MAPQFAAGRVTATAEAIELIEDLRSTHGPLAFGCIGSSCDTGELRCLTRAELLPDADDLRVGEIGGAPVYVDATRYELWGHPEFVVDIAPGPAAGIRLGGLEDRHFVTRAAGPQRRFRPAGDAAGAHP